jgi:hypothetical protein
MMRYAVKAVSEHKCASLAKLYSTLESRSWLQIPRQSGECRDLWGQMEEIGNW